MSQIRKSGIMVLLMMILLLIIGCSNKTLSFFFDGVPVAEEKQKIAFNDSVQKSDSARISEIIAKVATPLYKIHLPYNEKECGACHDKNSMGKFLLPQPDLCYQCHEDFADEYKVLHAPVEGGECTACHSPHMSKNEKFLLRIGQQLCFYCHDQEDILSLESHEYLDGADCIECHNPHGGEDEYMFN